MLHKCRFRFDAVDVFLDVEYDGSNYPKDVTIEFNDGAVTFVKAELDDRKNFTVAVPSDYNIVFGTCIIIYGGDEYIVTNPFVFAEQNTADRDYVQRMILSENRHISDENAFFHYVRCVLPYMGVGTSLYYEVLGVFQRLVEQEPSRSEYSRSQPGLGRWI